MYFHWMFPECVLCIILGAKPVYELKSKPDHVTPKLGIKDTARKDSKRYDMVFDDEDSDEGKRKKSDGKPKHSDTKRRRRSSSNDDRYDRKRSATVSRLFKEYYHSANSFIVIAFFLFLGNTKMTTRRNKPEKK